MDRSDNFLADPSPTRFSRFLRGLAPRSLVSPVNYYRIKKGRAERTVNCWFQTFNGVYTSEQQRKAHRVWDAVFDNSTDMVPVRLIVPVTASGIQVADLRAKSFSSTCR